MFTARREGKPIAASLVAIENKTKEPRTHISLATAARTLVGIQTLGRDDVGIVVDLGHSLFAKETPADVLSLVHGLGRLFTIEVNDNWREWDDDMLVGSVHLVETLEFDAAVDRLDTEALQDAQAAQDAVAAQRVVMDLLLGEAPVPEATR